MTDDSIIISIRVNDNILKMTMEELIELKKKILTILPEPNVYPIYPVYPRQEGKEYPQYPIVTNTNNTKEE